VLIRPVRVQTAMNRITTEAIGCIGLASFIACLAVRFARIRGLGSAGASTRIGDVGKSRVARAIIIASEYRP